MRKICLFLIASSISWGLFADEGMWLPLLLKALNEQDMQTMGLKLTAEDIYSVNKSSLKDAVMIFGGGCTGETVSADGLLITNHHCGFGAIQQLSTVEHDYLTNGFWAKNRNDELPAAGLTVTFIIRMEDVTAAALSGVTATMSEAERNGRITQNCQTLMRSTVAGSHYEASIRPFYNGNEYYMFITETFRDVRLVGTPPQAMGNFGGDTDNWVWPRHTADFSMFRIYAGADNKPAAYSANNKPFKPRHFLPISLKGVQEGDFTMVYGFPGRTQEYLTANGVALAAEVSDPIRIELRTKRLAIMEEEMKRSDSVRIQYAAKYAGIANGWKKWQGEVKGLKKNDVIGKKEAYEADFAKRVAEKPEWKAKYGDLLPQLQKSYADLTPIVREDEYMSEACRAIEAIRVAGGFSQIAMLLQAKQADSATKIITKLRANLTGFYKDYSPVIDQRVAAALLEDYMKNIPANRRPSFFATIETKWKGDVRAYIADAFAKSMFPYPAKLDAFLNSPNAKKLATDPLYIMAESITAWAEKEIDPKRGPLGQQLEVLQRTYMQAQREVMTERKFYPDANSTLRLTYGKVQGYSPDEALSYRYYTTLDGIIEKNISGIDDYKIPTRLHELWQKRDYGRYANASGELRTCFVAMNHTSGGNSGSPVINGNGELVGVNFDRVWDGTMSDINYDVTRCRNISCDIRYLLWVVDVYAGAGYLLNEMKIVQ